MEKTAVSGLFYREQRACSCLEANGDRCLESLSLLGQTPTNERQKILGNGYREAVATR